MSQRIAATYPEYFRQPEIGGDIRFDEEAIAILGLLADPDARAILLATATEPYSVPELVTICEIPTATAYRKVEALVSADLLAKSIRIRPHGRNANEYRLQPRSITIDISPQGEPIVALSPPTD